MLFSAFRQFIVIAAAVFFFPPLVHATDFKFTSGGETPGFKTIAPDTVYDAGRGYGYLNTPVLTSTNAAYPIPATRVLAVDVPEGNYDVSIMFGDFNAATSTTVKAESRRLMLENVNTKPGQFITRSFTVNVRTPAISPGHDVLIDAREKGPPVVPDWDTHLTLEFLGGNPGMTTLSLKPNPAAVTLYVAGDSTVTDQAAEPWSAWGQMLPRFLNPGIAVADYAQSGLTLTTFEHQRRLEKILSVIKPGDYLFIQFGHNDQKDKAPGSGPYTTYKANLTRYVQLAQAKKATAVIVTPMERRRWANGQPQPTLADFAEAAREVGKEQNVPVIDLNAMSLQLYTALGQDDSTRLFVHYPADTFPNQPKALTDDTHHSPYGAYELAKCVAVGIVKNVPGVARFLKKDVTTFDPTHPDAFSGFQIPASPLPVAPLQRPAGS